MVARQIPVNFRLSVVSNPRSPHYGAIEIAYKPAKQGTFILSIFHGKNEEAQIGGCPARLTILSPLNSNFEVIYIYLCYIDIYV